jgi:hypothetical protein
MQQIRAHNTLIDDRTMAKTDFELDTVDNALSDVISHEDPIGFGNFPGNFPSEEILTSGFGKDSYEASRRIAAFWETVWPKLEEGGWEKKVSS